MYIIDFEVSGTGRFPLDMLRYDACHPIMSEDAAAMDHYPGEAPRRRTVHLRTYSATKSGRQLTPDRWLSFNWALDAKSIRVQRA